MLEDLKQLLALPTAPFREKFIADYVTASLEKNNIPYFIDQFGNIVAGASSKRDYLKLLQKKSREPVRVFIAHMDHPGFHGVKWLKNNNLQIKWYGGSPVKYLAGASMYLCNDEGVFLTGKLVKPKLVKAKWAIDTAEIRVDKNETGKGNRPEAKNIFGSFKFSKPVKVRGNKIYTNAADDLCGVFAILQTAIKVFKNKRSKNNKSFIGLFTRAEEVGFVGAVSHFNMGYLQKAKRPIACISLEASRTLPGAIIGKGPVVRLGDRRTVFNENYLKVLSDLAEKILKGKHQKRIMDGGACEATAATVFELPAIGISLPLGNYHNQGFEGGPECRGQGGPAPEFVHINDIEGEIKLCQALMRSDLSWQQPWKKQKKLLLENKNRYAKSMKTL